jgi:hypothetical protein
VPKLKGFVGSNCAKIALVVRLKHVQDAPRVSFELFAVVQPAATLCASVHVPELKLVIVVAVRTDHHVEIFIPGKTANLARDGLLAEQAGVHGVPDLYAFLGLTASSGGQNTTFPGAPGQRLDCSLVAFELVDVAKF